jgi:cbb3-type cytochrome oxidase subunit 1
MDFPKTNAAHYNDTVVRQFSIMAVVWGVVGMLVGDHCRPAGMARTQPRHFMA